MITEWVTSRRGRWGGRVARYGDDEILALANNGALMCFEVVGKFVCYVTRTRLQTCDPISIYGKHQTKTTTNPVGSKKKIIKHRLFSFTLALAAFDGINAAQNWNKQSTTLIIIINIIIIIIVDCLLVVLRRRIAQSRLCGSMFLWIDIFFC